MMDSCYRKCISTPYHAPELSKGESVCLDRCVAKYFDVQRQISTEMFQANERKTEGISN
ncbi:protein transporter tim10, partial [Nowakowskiella sp. JEL0078]